MVIETHLVEIPPEFILQRVPLTWREVQFGLENGLCSPAVAKAMASDALGRGEISDPLLVLGFELPELQVWHPVKALAEGTAPQEQSEILRIWGFLILDWTVASGDPTVDPLEVAEGIYADLDYPQRMDSFIRYLPSSAPDRGSVAEAEEYLLCQLGAYLEAEKQYFARNRSRR